MKIIERSQKIIETEADVVCDRCGESCYSSGYRQGFSAIFEVMSDGNETWAPLDVCRSCAEKFISGFKHPIKWE